MHHYSAAHCGWNVDKSVSPKGTAPLASDQDIYAASNVHQTGYKELNKSLWSKTNQLGLYL